MSIEPPKDYAIPVEECKSDAERFGLTTCAECNELIHQSDALVKVFYRDNMQHQEHFCCEGCMHVWYIKELNRESRP